MKRYEFTGETRDYYGRTLHRIRALVVITAAFGTVTVASPGDKGGWIESEENLSHGGSGWVSGEAVACGNASIEGGTIEGGTIWGGTIRGGTIWGGTIRGGTIEGGTIWGGTIWGGTIWGGTIRGGTIEGGTIRGGTIWGGTIWGGTIWGGTIWGGTVKIDPIFLAGLTWPVTITDTEMTIGCQSHSITAWWAFDDDQIKRMDVRSAPGFWKTWKPTLQLLCEQTARPRAVEEAETPATEVEAG